MEQKRSYKLDHTQQAVIHALAKSPLRDLFYWTGGTALAFYYLQHRKSYDIDLFSGQKFSFEQVIPFVRDLKKLCKFEHVEQKKVYDRYEFFLHNAIDVRLEFVFYDFKQLKKPTAWQGISIDSLDDMAANKTMALIERHEPKDIVDIYFLMKKKKYTVEKFLSLAEKKFGVSFSPYLFWAEALRASKNLSRIRPMLFGNQSKQEETILAIRTFVERSAAGCVNSGFEE